MDTCLECPMDEQSVYVESAAFKSLSSYVLRLRLPGGQAEAVSTFECPLRCHTHLRMHSKLLPEPDRPGFLSANIQEVGPAAILSRSRHTVVILLHIGAWGRNRNRRRFHQTSGTPEAYSGNM